MFRASKVTYVRINALNAELNSICHLLALRVLEVHPILHVSRVRVK
jgi:hypothetical protein